MAEFHPTYPDSSFVEFEFESPGDPRSEEITDRPRDF